MVWGKRGEIRRSSSAGEENPRTSSVYARSAALIGGKWITGTLEPALEGGWKLEGKQYDQGGLQIGNKVDLLGPNVHSLWNKY